MKKNIKEIYLLTIILFIGLFPTKIFASIITLDKNKMTVGICETCYGRLYATIPSELNESNIIWRSSNENIAKVENGKIFINGKETDTYKFKMDYYWMMGDNRDNSADSRYWGFVPEDHIIGTPMFVIISIDEEKGLFKGFRFNRMFKDANPDK